MLDHRFGCLDDSPLNGLPLAAPHEPQREVEQTAKDQVDTVEAELASSVSPGTRT